MSYTLFGQGAAGSGAFAGPYTLGVQFSVSQAGTLTGIWFYSPATAGALPQTIALYAVSGGSLVRSESASWSGAAGSGWVRAAFASPPSLSASTAYEACVLQNTGSTFYSATSNYWSSGAGSAGITSGPLTAPNNGSAANGQDCFNSGSSLTFPSGSFNAANYWIDPEFTAAAAATVARLPASGVASRRRPARGRWRGTVIQVAGKAFTVGWLTSWTSAGIAVPGLLDEAGSAVLDEAGSFILSEDGS